MNDACPPTGKRARPISASAMIARRNRCAGAAIVGMGLLGVLAMIAADPRGVLHLGVDLVVLPICFYIGLIVGIPAAPIVALCVPQKQMRLGLGITYATAAVAVVIHARSGGGSLAFPLDTAVTAFVAVILLSGCVRVALPDVYVVDPYSDRCTTCNYDLRGNPKGVCPECGTISKPAAERD